MVTKLISYLMTQMVEHPEVVVVEEVTSADGRHVIEIRVAAQDMARVIGREGATLKALRSLLAAVYPDERKDIVVNSAS